MHAVSASGLLAKIIEFWQNVYKDPFLVTKSFPVFFNGSFLSEDIPA